MKEAQKNKSIITIAFYSVFFFFITKTKDGFHSFWNGFWFSIRTNSLIQDSGDHNHILLSFLLLYNQNKRLILIFYHGQIRESKIPENVNFFLMIGVQIELIVLSRRRVCSKVSVYPFFPSFTSRSKVFNL